MLAATAAAATSAAATVTATAKSSFSSLSISPEKNVTRQTSFFAFFNYKKVVSVELLIFPEKYRACATVFMDSKKTFSNKNRCDFLPSTVNRSKTEKVKLSSRRSGEENEKKHVR